MTQEAVIDLVARKDLVSEANMQRSIKDCGACRGCYHRVGIGRGRKFEITVVCDLKGSTLPSSQCPVRKEGDRTVGAHTYVPNTFDAMLLSA